MGAGGLLEQLRNSEKMFEAPGHLFGRGHLLIKEGVFHFYGGAAFEGGACLRNKGCLCKLQAFSIMGVGHLLEQLQNLEKSI